MSSDIKARPFGDPGVAKLLVIGHDPRLRQSDTFAEFCFFADYFFRPEPSKSSEKSKFGLANSLYTMVSDLTDGRVSPEEVLVTNLCNYPLPHAPKGKTVLITKEDAIRGIAEIKHLIAGAHLAAILAMSVQVNYWLQELGFCSSVPAFLDAAAPRSKGLTSSQPYYQETLESPFMKICGIKLTSSVGTPVFPVLHPKTWSLGGDAALAYASRHDETRKQLIEILS